MTRAERDSVLEAFRAETRRITGETDPEAATTESAADLIIR